MFVISSSASVVSQSGDTQRRDSFSVIPFPFLPSPRSLRNHCWSVHAEYAIRERARAPVRVRKRVDERVRVRPLLF